MSAADNRYGGEVEAVDRLARQRPGFGEMALNTLPIAFGDLVFCQRREEAGGGPSLLVGGLGKACPASPDCGQPQIIEDQRQPRGIDRTGHAAAPVWVSSSA